MWDVLSEKAIRDIQRLAAARQIPREALGLKGATRSLKETLLAMPNAGEDRNFERLEDHGRAVEH